LQADVPKAKARAVAQVHLGKTTHTTWLYPKTLDEDAGERRFCQGYVLSEHRAEDASGRTIIEANIAHHITFSVEHIKQEPKITHTTKRSTVT